MSLADCPLCKSPGRMLERLAQGALFCNACGKVFAVDENGKVVKVVRTQHEPVGRRDGPSSRAQES